MIQKPENLGALIYLTALTGVQIVAGSIAWNTFLRTPVLHSAPVWFMMLLCSLSTLLCIYWTVNWTVKYWIQRLKHIVKPLRVFIRVHDIKLLHNGAFALVDIPAANRLNEYFLLDVKLFGQPVSRDSFWFAEADRDAVDFEHANFRNFEIAPGDPDAAGSVK